MTNFDKCSIIINQICAQTEPGKKMLQKLMYLIERDGLNLDLNYSIHFFGPYSSKLDSALHTLESYDEISIDTSGPTHIIRRGTSESRGTLETQDQKKVDFVLNNFINKSAHDLEAITTVDYVASKMLENKGSDQEIIDRVRQIKGTKFSKECLSGCLQTLKQLEFLPA